PTAPRRARPPPVVARLPKSARVAQWIERLPPEQKLVGSNPVAGTERIPGQRPVRPADRGLLVVAPMRAPAPRRGGAGSGLAALAPVAAAPERPRGPGPAGPRPCRRRPPSRPRHRCRAARRRTRR